MKLTFAATVVLAVAIFDSAAGAATTVTEHDENRAALLRGVSASDEEPKQEAHGRRLATVTPLPNGETCDSGDQCASGRCTAGGVCEALRCFTYDGHTNTIPVTEQCEKAAANCCGGDNSCENFHGTVCATDSLPACHGAKSCYGAGVTANGEARPVRIEPGSCNSQFACLYTTGIAVNEQSCNGEAACASVNGAEVIIGSGSCNAKQACNSVSAVNIPVSSCNAEAACVFAKAFPTAGSGEEVCNGPWSCYEAPSWRNPFVAGSQCNECCECASTTKCPDGSSSSPRCD